MKGKMKLVLLLRDKQDPQRPDPQRRTSHYVCTWQKFKKYLLNKQMNSWGSQLSCPTYLHSINKIHSSQLCQLVSCLSCEPYCAPNNTQFLCCLCSLGFKWLSSGKMSKVPKFLYRACWGGETWLKEDTRKKKFFNGMTYIKYTTQILIVQCYKMCICIHHVTTTQIQNIHHPRGSLMHFLGTMR